VTNSYLHRSATGASQAHAVAACLASMDQSLAVAVGGRLSRPNDDQIGRIDLLEPWGRQ
jgi:hypothetical protein